MTDPIHPASGDLEAIAAIIREARTDHERGASRPGDDAETFAARRILAALRPANPSCQACAGRIEGWTCQGCGATFRERDGKLIMDRPANPPATAASYLETVRLPLSATDDMIQSINAWSDDPSMDGGAIYDAILGHYAAPYSYATAAAAGVGEAVACSRCGGSDLMMCDCSLPYTTPASHDALIAHDCFECSTPLIGPLCPKCNPAHDDALIARVREVLEPFAAAFGLIRPDDPDNDKPAWARVSDYKAARALLTDLDARDGG